MTSEALALRENLRRTRGFLRHTVRELTDEQARSRPTVSELCLGGILKHVLEVERKWARFIVEGPTAIGDIEGWDSPLIAEFMATFQPTEQETLQKLLAEYATVAEATDELIVTTDLDASQPLPKAPWFEGGEQQARTTILHLISETAQHAGHADIIRESIDGQKTMG